MEELDTTVQKSRGYREYTISGIDKVIIARKGGPTASQIKTQPSYNQLRKNQKEFGVASVMAKTLRQSLSSTMSEICETYLSGKLTAKFRNLAKLEEGQTGTRPLHISKHGHLFNGFDFNSSSPYNETFKAKYFVKPTEDRNRVILHFPSFIPEKMVEKPEEATNFKITARLIALSDYNYDAESGYYPVNEDLNGEFGGYESSMLPILKMPLDPITASVALPHNHIPQDTGLFLVMAISFYKYQDGKFEHLSKSSSMQVLKVL